jgi:malate dehydrogenase (oxaloacetate-decarboxylating)
MTSTSSADSRVQRVAIVSDGSALPSGDDLTTALREEAELISGLARVPARVTVILASDAAGLAAGIRALPADIGAVLLTRVEPERARHVQQELQDSRARPLLTDADVTAIALAAAALGSLAYAGRRTQGGRVVLAGTRDLPLLAALLMAAGVGDITTWHQSDAVIFPLHNIVFGADTVIDLVGELPSSATSRLAGITVITRDDAGAAPYAAAGLLQAAVHAPGLTFDFEVYRACAHALTAAPASDRPVPYLKGIALTQLIADAVFHTQHSR